MAFFVRDFFDDPYFARSPLELFSILEAATPSRRITQDSSPNTASDKDKDSATSAGTVSQQPQQRGLGTAMRSFKAPRIDVEETEKAYIIKADLPGLKKEEVQVHLKDDILTIEGERHDDREEKTSTRHVVERSFGKFVRSIQLPSDADTENAAGSVEDGVLRISFNKKAAPSETRKQIPIA
ncbi:hypothetical protein SmJEL517_g00520 [Synchytrium microbalum]|uniref:SHSP domain-containing protein n=1 Tax=Synchytrium microbalum TaxID=1806994 RepID=A0A507C8X6_9FUNG|nr:uncharacterized protein SmJEL517_g00520 [Synchytrium microbalum]TPX37507.1 hypothetical protein SmJEL517_g00520 [Synchytrium microbalum]